MKFKNRIECKYRLTNAINVGLRQPNRVLNLLTSRITSLGGHFPFENTARSSRENVPNGLLRERVRWYELLGPRIAKVLLDPDDG